MRSQREVDNVLALSREVSNASEIARRTGIPRSTIRDWLRCPKPDRSRDCPGHDPSLVDETAYAYLLGMYLGDGCISAHPSSVWRLRITLDSAYPRIVTECAQAVETVAPGRAGVYRRRGSRAIDVSNYWKHWPCLIPQHGSGRKHLRPIVLDDWQERIVSANVEPFLRGLIHSDGTRIVATERKGTRMRGAPRYEFSNRSEDILKLFFHACEIAGVHCTRSSRVHMSVYSNAAVARLDQFIGPKA